MKRLLAILLCIVMLVGILPVTASAAEVWETEPNDNRAQANPISTANTTFGTLDKLLSLPSNAATGDFHDYFTFTLTQKSEVFVAFACNVSNISVSIVANDSQGTYLAHGKDAGMSGSVYTKTILTTLSPGKYYIYVGGFCTTAYVQYALKPTITPIGSSGGSGGSDTATKEHTITYNSAELPENKLTFYCGDTATIPFILTKGSKGSDTDKYYIEIVDTNDKRVKHTSSEFAFSSSNSKNISMTWEVYCEPGTYYLEYYSSDTYFDDHPQIPITVKEIPGEHIVTFNTVKQQAVTGNYTKATCAWHINTLSFQKYSIYDPLSLEIQLKEMYFGTTATGVAQSETTINALPSANQQWILMKFHVKNLGNSTLDMSDIFFSTPYYTKNGQRISAYDTASFYGNREGLDLYSTDIASNASTDVWVGILVDKSIGFPLLEIPVGRNSYVYLDTDPFRSDFHQHNYSVEVSRVNATCTNAGSVTNKCTCGATTTSSIAPKGHTMVNGICSVCGFDLPFADVKLTDWYYDAVKFAYKNNLFNGSSATTFGPAKTMTRAMLVTVLWRYAGSPDVGNSTFSDVKSDAYYAKAVAWASSTNVVNGVGNNRFNPDGTITREQMATILYRYAQNNGYSTDITGNLSAFPDGNTVSSYAVDALSWAVGMELINGSNGKLLPQNGATRAQVAAILMRFIENCYPI